MSRYGDRWWRRVAFGIPWLTAAASALAGDWPSFRGPHGNGVADETKAPLHWSTNRNVRWRAPLPGPGNSSPITSKGRVFLTCADDEGRQRNLYAFDAGTGERRWVRTVAVPAGEPTHRSNPFCGSTPATDGSRVVVWHGSAGVFSYDLDGSELWHTDLGALRHEWGYGSSPIITGGKVIVNFGPGARTFLAALDLKSGHLLWQYDEPGGRDTMEKRMVG